MTLKSGSRKPCRPRQAEEKPMHVLPPWVHPDIDPSNTICCRFDIGPTLCFGAMSPAGLCAVPHLHPTPRRASQALQMNPFVPFSHLYVFSLYLSLERKLSAALPVPLGWAISHPVQRGMQDAPIPPIAPCSTCLAARGGRQGRGWWGEKSSPAARQGHAASQKCFFLCVAPVKTFFLLCPDSALLQTPWGAWLEL